MAQPQPESSTVFFMLPIELVREIVQFLILNSCAELGQINGKQVPGFSNKPSWEILDAFTRTCRDFRQLALEAWFNTLLLTREADTQQLDLYFPEAKEKWCRSVKSHDIPNIHYRLTSHNHQGRFTVCNESTRDWLTLLSGTWQDSDEYSPFG